MKLLIYFSAFLNTFAAGAVLIVLSESKDPVTFGLLIGHVAILAVLGLLLIHKER